MKKKKREWDIIRTFIIILNLAFLGVSFLPCMTRTTTTTAAALDAISNTETIVKRVHVEYANLLFAIVYFVEMMAAFSKTISDTIYGLLLNLVKTGGLIWYGEILYEVKYYFARLTYIADSSEIVRETYEIYQYGYLLLLLGAVITVLYLIDLVGLLKTRAKHRKMAKKIKMAEKEAKAERKAEKKAEKAKEKTAAETETETEEDYKETEK